MSRRGSHLAKVRTEVFCRNAAEIFEALLESFPTAMTLQDILYVTGLPRGTVYRILHEELIPMNFCRLLLDDVEKTHRFKAVPFDYKRSHESLAQHYLPWEP